MSFQSIPCFVFSSCFLRGFQFSLKLISPQHRLLHFIRSYYLLIYKVVIDLFHSFRLNCSPFYVFNDGKVVFSLFIILFLFSRFNFCSCNSVCFGLFGCALFGCVAFTFTVVSGSFLFDCFHLLILDVSGTVVLSCSLSGIFSSISRSKTQPFFIIVLTWSASFWLVV